MSRKPRIHTKPQLITWELFKQIHHGDILITGWTEHRDGSYRLVLQGPADYRTPDELEIPTSKAYVTVPIRHRSWTNRAHTMMNFYDLTSGGYRDSYVLRPKRGARWLCAIERDILERSGFDVAKELERELAEDERIAQAFAANGVDHWETDPKCKRWLQAFLKRARKQRKAP